MPNHTPSAKAVLLSGARKAAAPLGRFVAANTLLAATTLFAATPETREAVRARLDAECPAPESTYNNLHANPELSFREVKTACRSRKPRARLTPARPS